MKKNRKDNKLEMGVFLDVVDLAEALTWEIISQWEERRSVSLLEDIVAWAKTSHKVFRAAQLYGEGGYPAEMADVMYRVYGLHIMTGAPWYSALSSRMGAVLLDAAELDPEIAATVQLLRQKGCFVAPSAEHVRAMNEPDAIPVANAISV